MGRKTEETSREGERIASVMTMDHALQRPAGWGSGRWTCGHYGTGSACHRWALVLNEVQEAASRLLRPPEGFLGEGIRSDNSARFGTPWLFFAASLWGETRPPWEQSFDAALRACLPWWPGKTHNKALTLQPPSVSLERNCCFL